MVNLPRTTDDRWDTATEAGDGADDEATELWEAAESLDQPHALEALESSEPEQQKKEPKYQNVVEFVHCRRPS